MFGIGGFELFIIVVFIFVLFGPDKLPEIIKITGLGIKKFRKAKAEMDQVLQEEIVDPVMKVANEPDKPKKSKTEDNVDDKNTEKNKLKEPKIKANSESKSSTKKTTKQNTTKKNSSTKSASTEKKGGK